MDASSPSDAADPVAMDTAHGWESADPVLDLVLRRVRLRARRRCAWLRNLWADEREPGGKLAVTHAEMDTHLAGRDAPQDEAAWLAAEPGAAPWTRELAAVEAALTADTGSHLAQLGQSFGLGPADRDILQACLAELLDPALARVYAYLQDQAGRAYVSEDLVARLFGHGRSGLWQEASPLARWGLVRAREQEAGEPAQLTCDPWIRGWLQGERSLDPVLVGLASVQPVLEPLERWPVAQTADHIERVAYGDTGTRVRVLLSGLPGSGRRTLAAGIAARLGLGLLSIDTDRIPAEQWPRVYLRAQRQAYLDGLALA